MWEIKHFVKNEESEEEVYDNNSNDTDSGVSGDVSTVKKAPKKWKNKAREDNNSKKQKSDEKLTVEEINELKETEDLYHSSLFRM